MTTTIVIGPVPKEVTKTPIKFSLYLSDYSLEIKEMSAKPHHFMYIELICRDYNNDYDLMFAYDDPDYRKDGVLVLGKWNDGVGE